MEGKIKSFVDKRRLKEYISTKPALQEMLKGLLKNMKVGGGHTSTKEKIGNE